MSGYFVFDCGWGCRPSPLRALAADLLHGYATTVETPQPAMYDCSPWAATGVPSHNDPCTSVS